MASASAAFAASIAACKSAIFWAFVFTAEPAASPAWAASGDMIAACAVVSLRSLANAENGASNDEPVIAMVVAAVTASRAVL